MSKKKTEQKAGLSITSFVLSLVGLLLALTVIGSLFGVPLAIVGLVFGIIALVKKQKKGLAIAGVVIGGLVTLITATILIVGTIFLRNNSDVILEPIQELSELMENDPELAELMNTAEFRNQFETNFQERLVEKYGETEDMDNREDIKTEIPVIFDEMQNVMLELKEEYKSE